MNDLISRQAAIRIASGYCHPANITKELKRLPPVQPKIKTGHWIEDESEMKVWCSECGEDNDNCSKYCPNCGTKMVEPQESEENK